MKFLAILFATTVILINSGCATNIDAKSDDFKKNSKILVYIDLKNKFEIEKVGTTVFTNSLQSISLEKFNTEEFIENKVKEIIGPYYSIYMDKNLNRTPTNIKTNPYAFSGVQLLINSDLELNNYIKANGINYILYIHNVGAGDSAFGTNQLFSGFGIAQRNTLGQLKGSFYHAYFASSLHDATTGEEVDVTNGKIDERAYWADERLVEIESIDSIENFEKIHLNKYIEITKESVDLLLNRQLSSIFSK